MSEPIRRDDPQPERPRPSQPFPPGVPPTQPTRRRTGPVLLAALVACGPARADERAPAPRPVPDPGVAAVTAFFDDLKAGDPKAAHARVRTGTLPLMATADSLDKYWAALTGWHGPLGAVSVRRVNPQVVVADLAFARQPYRFGALAGTDGRLSPAGLAPQAREVPSLLRAGHGVRVTPADGNTATGLVTFAVPGTYRDQVPVGLTVAADPPAALKGYKLRKRDDGRNWVVEATVAPDKGGATVYWEALVLVRDRPAPAPPPAAAPEAPPAAAPWLRPTACVQGDDPGVVERAGKLAKPDVGAYAAAVTDWVSGNPGTGQPFASLDAKTALGCGGSCTSRANLAAALFRARGIPARTVAHLPVWAGPLYVHWLTEYWHPGLGWEWVEPTLARPRPPSAGLVVLSVSGPDDEDASVWPNRRSGVMDGAARLTGRELDGPIRTSPVLGTDLRTWGLAVPLATLDGTPVELDALWAAALAAHAGLTVNDPKRQRLATVAQTGGVAGLTAAVRTLGGD